MKKVPMTIIGINQLKKELFVLKTEKRPKIISAITTARSYGDLKENAEYLAAREQQSFLEGRIKDIEIKLSNAQIIDVTKFNNLGKVIFGSTLELFNFNTKLNVIYKIVGEDEANIKYGKISVLSPIARSLIGNFENNIVKLNTPCGIVLYRITKVSYS